MRLHHMLASFGNKMTSLELSGGLDLRLQGRCSRRICYSPKTTRRGDRAYGSLVVEADVLAAEMSRRISPSEFNENHIADTRLYKWVRDHDRSNADVTTLSIDLPLFESTLEQLFLNGTARMFCSCCNRNYRRSEILMALAGLGDDTMYHYYCPKGHLLVAFDAVRAKTNPTESLADTMRIEVAA